MAEERCTQEGLPRIIEETIKSYSAESSRKSIGGKAKNVFGQLEKIKLDNPFLHKYHLDRAKLIREKLGEEAEMMYLTGAAENYDLLIRQKQINDLDEQKCE